MNNESLARNARPLPALLAGEAVLWLCKSRLADPERKQFFVEMHRSKMTCEYSPTRVNRAPSKAGRYVRCTEAQQVHGRFHLLLLSIGKFVCSRVNASLPVAEPRVHSSKIA